MLARNRAFHLDGTGAILEILTERFWNGPGQNGSFRCRAFGNGKVPQKNQFREKPLCCNFRKSFTAGGLEEPFPPVETSQEGRNGM